MKNNLTDIKQQSAAKVKLKKNALEAVDFEKEWKKDPKYKTELCKSFESKNICMYGNKCRFAHGKSELFDKASNPQNYKQKKCFSFYQHGFCSYGKRCSFLHSENNFHEMKRSYYSLLMPIFHSKSLNEISPTNHLLGPINCNKNNDSAFSSPNKTSSISDHYSSPSTNFNDSIKSNYTTNLNNYSRRLFAFNEIYLENIKSNFDENFENFDGKSYLFNCNYQTIVPLISN